MDYGREGGFNGDVMVVVFRINKISESLCAYEVGILTAGRDVGTQELNSADV